MKLIMRILSLAALCTVLGSCDRRPPAPPKSDITRIEAINVRFNGGEFEEARKEAESYTKEYPDCDNGWRVLGWAHAKLDHLDDAIRFFEMSIRLNPRSDNAHVGLGAVRRKKGDLKGARESYAEAIRILPENAEAYSSLLVIELLEKNYQAAVKCGEKGWKLRKDSPTIPANLAVAYHYLGNVEKRDYFYQEAKKLGYHRLDTLDEIFAGTLSIGSP